MLRHSAILCLDRHLAISDSFFCIFLYCKSITSYVFGGWVYDTTASRQTGGEQTERGGGHAHYLLELNRLPVDRRPLKPRCGGRPLHEDSERRSLVSFHPTVDGQSRVLRTL